MTHHDSTYAERPRFYELDILRFLAALAVVFFHYTFLNATDSKFVPVYPVLGDAFKYGYLGVELFFIISGFVILLTTRNKGPIEFIISRVTRLYPAFWLGVTLTSITLLLFVSGGLNEISLNQYLINMSMIPEYLGVKNIDAVYWTLQVEIKFYFWVFVIIILSKIQYIERFIMFWLLLSILETFHFMHDFTHLLLIPEWAPYFSAGALFYRIKTQGLNWQRGTMLSLAYLLSIYFALQEANEKNLIYDTDFSPIAVFAIISTFYVCFTLIITGKTAYFNRSFFMVIGSLTYPLYLIHNVIGKNAFIHFSQSLNKYTLLILVLIFMLSISYLICRYVEPKFGKKMKAALLKLAVITNKLEEK